jgi:hypothetical protein
MIADGVSPIKAKIMYFAVYRFGPKWVVDKTVTCPVGYLCGAGGPPLQVTLQARPKSTAADAERSIKRIEAENPDASDIERIADEELFSDNSQLQVSGKETGADGKVRTIDQSVAGSMLYRVLSSD